MTSPEQILHDFRSTRKAVREEEQQRQQIRNSTEYQTLEAEITRLQAQQQEMLSGVPDSAEEFQADKAALMQWMKDNGEDRAGEFRAKKRAKRYVDVLAVLRAFEGDLDSLMTVVSCTQKLLPPTLHAAFPLELIESTRRGVCNRFSNVKGPARAGPF